MIPFRPIARGVLAALVVASCAQEPVPEPPPLFSAYDPTVTCPAGQLGWDLSTGGGIEPLERNSVGDTIKLLNSTLTGCGLTGMDLRGACDGEAECVRPVTCDDGAVDVTYVCGTETNTYRARVEGTGADRILRVSCGLPITVLRATYAPNSSTPADISSALAATCSGKRRCANGMSGFALNSFRDPAPNQTKTVRVTYRCGVEGAERISELDDFKLDFYCPMSATKFPIRERLRIVSAAPRLEAISGHADNLAYANELLEQLRSSCDGKTQCDVTFTGKRRDGSTPGNWTPERSLSKSWNLKGRDAMGWPDTLGPPIVGISRGGNLLIVGYTCGDGTWVEQRAVDPLGSPPDNRINLRCGDFVRVTDLTAKYPDAAERADPTLLSVMKARCDGRRACTLPFGFGTASSLRTRWFGPDGGSQETPERVNVTYSCGELTNSVSSVVTVDTLQSINKAQLECPSAAEDLLTTGIRLVSVTPPERTLEVTRACGGRSGCTVPPGVSATYRCQDDPQIKNSTPDMNCNTPVYPVSITHTRGMYPCFQQPDRETCVRNGQPGNCFFYPLYSSGYELGQCGDVTVNYTCGCDPTIRSVTTAPIASGPMAGRYNFPTVLTCPPVATACKRKACVPIACYGATRRNADLACVSDTTIKPTHFITRAVVNDWVALPDGGTHPIGRSIPRAPNTPVTYKSDYPYQVFSSVVYKTDDGSRLPDRTTATVWSYDSFALNAGAKRPDGGVLPAFALGMRCLLSEASMGGSEQVSTVPGYRWALIGGKAQTIPRNCFEQDGFNDPSTSTFDAARVVSLEESQFRQRYTYSKTLVVSSFDAQGTSITRRRAAGTAPTGAVAVNPIGFFYDPIRDYVSLSAYYGQQADFFRAIEARFVPSTEIELGAEFSTVSYGDLTLDVEKPEQLPSFDVDFSWYLRGDSPANAYSPRSRVANTPANTSLKDRNLRMTVEMARAETTGLANLWDPSNAVRFPSVPLSGGNNFLQTDHARLDVTPALRERLMTVRSDPNSLAPVTAPNGFMSNMLDDDTAFLVRACIDLDGLPRGLTDAPAPDGGVALPAIGGYSLRVAKRCSEPRTIVFRRQLFVRPTTPAVNEELKNDKGSVQPTGDRDVGGASASGAEVGCVRQCTDNTDCGVGGTCTPGVNGMLGTCLKTPENRRCRDDSRSEGGMSGQFPISLFDARSQTTSDVNVKRAGEQTTNCGSSRGALLGFNVMEPMPRCEDRLDDAEGWSLKMDFTPTFGPAIAAFKGKRFGVFNTDAKKALMKRKAKPKPPGDSGGGLSGLLGDAAEGLGLSASKEFNITIGPVPVIVEVGASAGFSLKLELEFGGEVARPGMMSRFYPCVNNMNTTCYSIDTVGKTFEAAQEACRLKGGSLALATSPFMLSEMNRSLDAADGGSRDGGGPTYWIGAQLAYAYEYPPCEKNGGKFIDGGLGPNGTFSTPCKTASSTSYEWLRGGSLAKQYGTNADILPGSNGINIFPNLRLPPSRIPEKAGVTYQRNGTLGSAANTTVLPSICSYDSASEVKATTFSKSFNIEFSVGLNAAVCVPNNRIGACLALEFKIFTAAWIFGSRQMETNVFRGVSNARVQQSLFGESRNFGTWERKLLHGSLDFQLRFYFFNQNFKIKDFALSDSLSWDGDLYPGTSSPYFRRLSE